jgi:hypothetical protein
MKRLILLGIKKRVQHGLQLSPALLVVSGIGLGAGLMYLLDPDRGGRRRARVRDTLARAISRTGCAIGNTSRDISNRARGLAAETNSLDKTLAARDTSRSQAPARPAYSG